jgi:hypothetical protein
MLWLIYLLVSLTLYAVVGFIAHTQQVIRSRTLLLLLVIATVVALVGMVGGLVFFSGALLALLAAWLLSLRSPHTSAAR